MGRAYLRLDPAFFDRKALDQKYPAGAVAALVGVLCQAEHQPQRGQFRNERVLRALLGPYAKWIPLLIKKRDLIKVGEQLYVDGWDEWQEGDWKVGERVKRIRGRRKADAGDPDVTVDVTVGVTPAVTVASESDDSVPTVDNLLESVIDGAGGRRSGGNSPQPPASGGRPSRANGTSKRAQDERARAEQDERDRGRAWRKNQRQLAYARGAIDELAQRAMDEADAPLAEIPDWQAHQERRAAEAAAASPLDEAGGWMPKGDG